MTPMASTLVLNVQFIVQMCVFDRQPSQTVSYGEQNRVIVILGSLSGPDIVDFRPICYSLGFHLKERS